MGRGKSDEGRGSTRAVHARIAATTRWRCVSVLWEGKKPEGEGGGEGE